MQLRSARERAPEPVIPMRKVTGTMSKKSDERLANAASRMAKARGATAEGSERLWAYALGHATASVLASGREATIANLIAALEAKPQFDDPGLQEFSSGAAIVHLREIEVDQRD